MSEDAPTPARVAVIYYSATGTVHRLAQAVAQGAESSGAEVRLRAVPELFSEMVISQNQHWGKHRSETQDEPEAELEDLAWADGFAFGTPTRFGNVAAQLKLFMDQAGGLWEQGKLVNKVGTRFHRVPDGTWGPGIHDPGPQQHPLPLGRNRAATRLHRERGLRRRREPTMAHPSSPRVASTVARTSARSPSLGPRGSG